MGLGGRFWGYEDVCGQHSCMLELMGMVVWAGEHVKCGKKLAMFGRGEGDMIAAFFL